MKTSPCVGSGLCCKKGPCPYGEWLESEHRCKFLEEGLKENKTIIYRCGRYEYIQKQPGSQMVPAFGEGCCMSLFNQNRSQIIQEIKAGNEKIIRFLQQA